VAEVELGCRKPSSIELCGFIPFLPRGLGEKEAGRSARLGSPRGFPTASHGGPAFPVGFVQLKP